MNNYETAVLQSTTSKGLTKYWQGFVESRGEGVFTHTESWQKLAEGSLSKRNVSSETRVKGKNIGKANETTPWDQAVFNITSQSNKKRKSGYCEEGETVVSNPLPMLAHEFTKRSHDIVYPCMVQPKLDGFRALTDGKKFWMRKGDEFDHEVIEHLLFNTEGRIVDGELMLPTPNNNVQDTSRVLKKFKAPGGEDGYHTRMVNYHVFDIVDEDIYDLDRQDIAEDLVFNARNKQVTYVRTLHCADEDDVLKFLKKYEDHGHEGVMIRNCEGRYRINQRSKDLQKLKSFQDAEFEIVGCIDGEGRDEGALMYVCKIESGATFKCRPVGKIEDRKKLWDDFNNGTFAPIGKMLTIRFQDYTKDGIPHFNRGISIRWDL